MSKQYADMILSGGSPILKNYKKDWNKDTIKENKASHDGAEILLGSMGKPGYLENAEKAVKNIGMFKKN